MKRFVIGDIHGELEKLDTLLSQWNVDNERLVFLGDFVDRGPNSYGVVERVRQLHEAYGADVVGGNHDQMLLDWLERPESYYYYGQGGGKTIDSFFGESLTHLYTPDHLAKRIKKEFPETIAFLEGLPNYLEWRDFVFVHAGVDLTYLDWRETNKPDFRWIREDFHYKPNKTGKTILFGHTPTFYLNKDKSFDVWVSPCGTKIGLDGGAVFGGNLHGLKINTAKDMTLHTLTADNQLKELALAI